MGEPAKLDQTEFGQHGNCQSACLAMLLGLDISDVPNFNATPGDNNAKWNAMREWLAARGWGIITIVPWQGLPWPPSRGFFIAGGVAPRGSRHAVIYKDGALWHDPHPERAGIASVDDLDILFPLNPAACAKGMERGDG